jgi:hypothetical protein
MREVVKLFIIVFMSSATTDEASSGNYKDKETSRGDTGPIVLGIWGNPIVSRALVLLLRGSGYEARFLPTSSLSEPRSLEGIRLLLLAPTPELSAERRKALLTALLRDTSSAKIPVLELVSPFKETREERVQGAPWQRIAWPCKTEDLKRRVEATLTVSPKVKHRSV